MCGPQTAVFTQMSSHFHMKPECHHPPPLPHSAAHSCPHAAPFTDLAKAFLWPRNKLKHKKKIFLARSVPSKNNCAAMKLVICNQYRSPDGKINCLQERQTTDSTQ